MAGDWTSDANPYRGLEAFHQRDADRFFGREALTEQVYADYRALHRAVPGAASVRLLAIVGPRGAGTSSFARAGLAALLARHPLPERPNSVVVTFEPGAVPLLRLGLALAKDVLGADAPVHAANDLALTMAEARDGRFEGLRRIVEALPAGAPRHLHLVIDRFEEIHTLVRRSDGVRCLRRHAARRSR